MMLKVEYEIKVLFGGTNSNLFLIVSKIASKEWKPENLLPGDKICITGEPFTRQIRYRTHYSDTHIKLHLKDDFLNKLDEVFSIGKEYEKRGWKVIKSRELLNLIDQLNDGKG